MTILQIAILGAGIFVKTQYYPRLSEISDIVSVKFIWSPSELKLRVSISVVWRPSGEINDLIVVLMKVRVLALRWFVLDNFSSMDVKLSQYQPQPLKWTKLYLHTIAYHATFNWRMMLCCFRNGCLQ
ncbi:uncharacterized protein LOC123199293 isoform X3 [Mangifera indica]|uniref:uncharacterized protein LOC123199293 isoform X3 n=1 Tax=Mangifera indica TaxID=29780 RepID=UPI001CF9FF6C|nr:uncharacterized protein LOC123199293 isoform X3 [Mangifera indica]